ncbi:MAG: TrmB family transcriptional regulator [Armatimonadetes bacterium]|nr:TrmB family transcriptional regulator [Armatimonadota bacterium]MDE2206098.1 TrmB family transcriptional regulator [Armatimonadota bacterium]
MDHELLSGLREFGWTEYEARAYLALLPLGRATGYRVAQVAGLPTAKIYEVLRRLERRGAVFAVISGDVRHTEYAAVELDEFLRGLRARSQRHLDAVEEGLLRLRQAPAAAAGGMTRLCGRDAVLEQAGRMLDGATRAALVAASPEYRLALRPAVTGCRRRGVSVAVHAAAPEGRCIALVVDEARLLLGSGAGASMEACCGECAGAAAALARLLPRGRTATATGAFEMTREQWLDFEEEKQRKLLIAVAAAGAAPWH